VNHRSPNYVRGAAFHEAGHAVIAWHLGLDIAEVWVDSESCAGKASIEHAASAHDDALITLAGHHASVIFASESTLELAPINDMARLMNLLDDNAPDDEAKQEQIRCSLYRQLDELFADPGIRNATTAVAEALLISSRLSGPQFSALVSPFLPRPNR
jgi:hypothetical protein